MKTKIKTTMRKLEPLVRLPKEGEIFVILHGNRYYMLDEESEFGTIVIAVTKLLEAMEDDT